MQPQAPQSVNKLTSRLDTLKQRQFFVPSICLVILAIIVAVLAWPSSHKNSSSNPDYFTYVNLEPAFLAGNTSSDHLHFNKPVPLTSFSGQQGTQIVFKQFSKTDPIRAIADIEIQSVDARTLSQQYKDTIGKNLTDSSSNSYAYQTKAFHNFVTGWLDHDYNVTFGQTTSFTNPSIKSSAWQATYTAVVKASSKRAKDLPELKGREVIMLGGSTVYYFMADAITHNWDSNSAIWQKVFDSIQIDQP